MRGAANGGGASAGAAGVLPASPPDVELTSPSAISQFGDAEAPRAHSSGGASPRGAQATAASVALLNSLSSLSSSLRTQVAAQRDALASDETTIASLSNAIHAMRSTMGAPLLTLSEVMLDGALRGALDVERVAACVNEQPVPASAPAASAEDVDSARAQLVKIARSMGVRLLRARVWRKRKLAFRVQSSCWTLSTRYGARLCWRSAWRATGWKTRSWRLT
ncbi:hypothetical protein EON68_02730 [archaeon]|nr:MAG: hypothetical protein EON68_02730 [archaeon]